ncbi:MAG: hypothetical protein ABI382_14445 [Nakamurella sp.]
MLNDAGTTNPLIGLVATTIFSVIQEWNEYLYALVLLRDNNEQTITI